MDGQRLFRVLLGVASEPLHSWMAARETVLVPFLDRWLAELRASLPKPSRPVVVPVNALQAILADRDPDDARSVIRAIAGLIDEMIGRGAPVKKDDAGFNASDFPYFMEYAARLRMVADPLELPIAYHIEAARRLVKYGATQLDGISERKADAQLLEDYAVKAGQVVLPPGVRLTGLQRGDVQNVEYAWNDGTVTDDGRKTGGAGSFRIGGHRGFHAKNFMESTGLVRGKDWALRKIGGAWYAEVQLDALGTVAEGLRRIGKAETADALLANALQWRALAVQSQVTREEEQRAVAKEREAVTAVAVRELDTSLADPALLAKARTIAERLRRLAAHELRSSEDYLKEATKVVAYFLTRGDVKPGVDHATVRYQNGEQGTFKVYQTPGPAGQVSEMVRVEAPFGLLPEKWWDRVPGARGSYDVRPVFNDYGKKIKAGQGFHVLVPMAQVVQASRVLDERNLPLSLALRYALLTDTLSRDCAELEALAHAGYFEDIFDPMLRAKAIAAARAIPTAPGIALYPYQQIGVVYAALTDFKCIIGDAMGLGKTAQAISCLSLAPGHLVPAVVVAPASVAYNWVREIKLFAPWFEPIVLKGTGAVPPATPGRTVYITTWTSLHGVWDELLSRGVRCAIFDESQKGKNPSARQTKAMLALCEKVPHRLLLSGTPISNTSADLWTQLRAVDPQEFGEKDDFIARYADVRSQTVRVKQPDGSTIERTFLKPEGGINSEELADRLRCFMVRRLKTAVAKDLPPKTRIPITVELAPAARAAYRKTESDLEQIVSAAFRLRMAAKAAKLLVEENRRGVPTAQAMSAVLDAVNKEAPSGEEARLAIVQLGYLRRITGLAKVPAAVEWLGDFWENNPDEPLVIFVEHLPVLEALGEALTKMKKRWTFIDGSVPAQERDRRVQGFQTGQFDVIIGTMAMETGVTLTRAKNMLFLERWWVPTREEQAEDRIHRIGQKNSASIYYLMAADTVDERLAEIVDKKQKVVRDVLGAEEIGVEQGRRTGAAAEGGVAESVTRAMVHGVLGRIAGAGLVTQADVLVALTALTAGMDPARVLGFDVKGKMVVKGGS